MGTVDFQQDFEEIPVLKFVPEQRSSDPTTSVIGRMWARTDLSTLKIWLGAAKTLVTTDDSRLTDSRTPSGTAGGSLTGTYPNPTLGNAVVASAQLSGTLIPTVNGGSAANNIPALRALGFLSGNAMPGHTTLDSVPSPTGDVSMQNFKILNVAAGAAAGDAVNKAQLDAALVGISGTNKIADTRIATHVGTWSGTTWTGVGSSLGGITVTAGSKVFVDQTGGSMERNGVFVWSAAASGTLTRVPEMDSWTEVPGSIVVVQQGTSADKAYLVVADPGGTLNTTTINSVPFGTVTTYTAGNGLAVDGGNVLSVNVDQSTIDITSDALYVKPGGITDNELAISAVNLAGTKVTGTLPIGKGGTGGATASTARGNLGVPGQTVLASPALTAGTWTDVAHSLGSKARSVNFKVASTGEAVGVAWRDKSGSATSTIQIKVDVVGGRAASYYDIDVLA